VLLVRDFIGAFIYKMSAGDTSCFSSKTVKQKKLGRRARLPHSIT